MYDRHAPVAFALSVRILGDRAGAEDVLQSVFMGVWQDAGRYDPERGSPTTWILAWVRNASIDRLRRRDVRKRAEHRIKPEGSAPPESPGSYEERQRLVAAIEQLPADQRLAIELAYFEGLSQSQIAGKLGEPLGAIKTRMRLGMIKLRQTLVTS